MTNDYVITARLNSVGETSAFGNAFGSQFLHPLVHAADEQNRQSLVVGAFGAERSGKTTFLQGAYNALSANHEKRFEWDIILKDETTSDNLVFRRKDFGVLTVFGGFIWEHKVMSSHSAGLILFAPRTETEGPGVDFLEHSPIAHVQHGGVIIISGRTHDGRTDTYAEGMKAAIGKEMEILKKNESASFEYIARSLNTAQCVIENMTQFDELLKQEMCRRGTDGPVNIMRVILTSESSSARAAFNNFHTQAAKTLELIG